MRLPWTGRDRLAVIDPAERLPAEARASLAATLRGTVIAPDRGVPVHPASATRLTRAAAAGRPVCVVPSIPESSQLGVPAIGPVLWWLPPPSSLVGSMIGWAESMLANPDGELRGARRVQADDPAEQRHYFSEHFALAVPAPRQVSVVVSNRCNLACGVCPFHSPIIRARHQTELFASSQRMEWQVLARLAEECGSDRIPVRVGNIEEPLLHPRIVEFVQACRAAGVPSVHITTNGTLLSGDLPRRLLDAGLTSIYVSIDAAEPETYRRMRGGDLARVETHVRHLVRLRDAGGYPTRILVSLVAHPQTSASEIARFERRWIEEADGAICYSLADYPDGSARYDTVHEVARARLDAAGKRWPCVNPFQEVYLLPDGRVFYCCETVGKLAFQPLESMGSYPQQSLRAIWAGEPFTALRRDLILGDFERWPACASCKVWMSHVLEVSERDGIRTTRNMITEIVERAASKPAPSWGKRWLERLVRRAEP